MSSQLSEAKKNLLAARAAIIEGQKTMLATDDDAELDYRALSIAISRLDESFLWVEAAQARTFVVKP